MSTDWQTLLSTAHHRADEGRFDEAAKHVEKAIQQTKLIPELYAVVMGKDRTADEPGYDAGYVYLAVKAAQAAQWTLAEAFLSRAEHHLRSTGSLFTWPSPRLTDCWLGFANHARWVSAWPSARRLIQRTKNCAPAGDIYINAVAESFESQVQCMECGHLYSRGWEDRYLTSCIGCGTPIDLGRIWRQRTENNYLEDGQNPYPFPPAGRRDFR